MARVGIDLDGVCYDFQESLKAYLHTLPKFKDREFPPSTCWEFYRVDWGLTDRQFIEYCHAGVDAGVIFSHGDPIEDAPNQLRRLRDAGHTIHIITDRSFGRSEGMASRQATERWLFKHGIPYDTLTFSADKTSVQTDYMIDDKLENYDALRRVGCDAWLLDRPWNSPPAGQTDLRAREDSLKGFVDHVLIVTDTNFERFDLPAFGSGEVRTTSSTGGQKGVKPQRFSLVPSYPLGLLAEHYAKGAEKYAGHQWRKGYEWSKSYDAMMRHATQWWEGEDNDNCKPGCPPDCVEHTGSSHVACVAWHAFALLQFIKDHPGFDDRPNSVHAE